MKRGNPVSRNRLWLGAAVASVVLGMTPAPSHAVSIIITNTDGNNEGFNDDTPAVPVGRNPGTTLGEQRQYVFQYAAEAWGLRLAGDVPVIVSASFDDLNGDEFGAVLGAANSTTVHRDFPGVLRDGTWYVSALANQSRGFDLNDLVPDDCPARLLDEQCPEIVSFFNSAVDDDLVLGNVNFYYGVDGNAGGNVDFLAVVLHEIGHGLGILDLVDPFSGQKYFGFDDAYIVNLEDKNINPKQMVRMSDAQRRLAVVDNEALVWVGPATLQAATTLTAGRRADGSPQVYAPIFYQPGSSIAHFDTNVFPNELMEPFITSPAPKDLRLTLAMLADIGWEKLPVPRCGDANNDTDISATDALQTLRGAVGSTTCPAEVCDVVSPGGVNSSDALPLLKYSVGQAVALSCP